MRLKTFATAVLAVSFAAAAHGQVASLYVTSSNNRFSNVATNGQDVNFWSSGIGGGVTVNFLPLPVVSLGFDFRGSTQPGTTGADTALVGIKLTVKPPLLRIKPYIQASAGYVATRTFSASNTTINNKYVAYEILGGIDYPLIHFVDMRVIEVGGGQTVLSGASNSPSLFSIDTGLVFHF
jgi:hypothetical protein